MQDTCFGWFRDNLQPMSRIRWSVVESSIELGELPKFHRAFLKLHRPELEADTLPLRRVQQYITQTLFTLTKEGKAERAEEDFLVDLEAIPQAYRAGF